MIGVRPVGDRALLVELDGLDEVMAFHARVKDSPLGQVDQVAAARTVLLTFATARQARRAAHLVRDVDVSPIPAGERRTIDIDVVYDGEDLGVVADLSGLSREAVVAAYTASDWVAAFGGFAPGFAYLAGGDPRLRVPRRDSPRTSVPAGSVALAGEFSAVYPRASPGGWRLIGRTDAALWDLERDPPALLQPGDAVRFRAVRADAAALRSGDRAETLTASADPSVPTALPSAASRRTDPPGGVGPSGDEVSTSVSALEVVAPGLLSLIEDLGRPGHADLGVTSSGAADPASARQANRLVGNARDAAVVESFGGLTVRAIGDQVVALAGADAPAEVTAPGEEGEPVGRGSAFLLRDGETLRIGMPVTGLRAYLAVRGGFDAPSVLGSRSADRLGGIGPAPLVAAATLVVGRAPGSAVSEAEPPIVMPGAETELRIRFGPRDDWFAESERMRLVGGTWTVGAASDRVGMRLEPDDGGTLRVREGELPSEGVVAGSLQVPPSGEPVLFGADHPVTGGYPVIAVVIAADLPLMGQLRPGARVRFRAVSRT
ncbi:urea amidolyase family protein [Microbacterium karelineae]|uniref:5-oxoprolinase subunit B/C family protein n=1 Tax=Microbacterium karelineae TaxID=2654283 RepID=UPI001E4DD57E|nr:urea amidolyase family protein [Microbacterium karelineae]